MLEEFKKIELRGFNGTWNRGDPYDIPQDHLVDSLNLKFLPTGTVFTRGGTSRFLTLTYPNGRVGRLLFLPLQSPHISFNGFFLMDDIGKLYIQSSATPLTYGQGITATVQDFRGTSLFGRAYFAVYYNLFSPGTNGGDAQQLPVQVYDAQYSVTQLREISPYPPLLSEGNMAAATGGGGNVPAGTYLIGVVYQTQSGYITPPGPFTTNVTTVPQYVSYTAPGGAKINLTNIPVRPPGGAADNIQRRFIVITKGTGFTQFFFVPDADCAPVLNDNSTTSCVINFVVTDLITDASYLVNYRYNPPPAVGITSYNGRTVLWGQNLNIVQHFFGNDVLADGSTLLISPAGQPEAFDNTTGFFLVNEGDGFFITNVFTLFSSLYVCKQQGVFSTQDPGNGIEPASWPTAIPIDGAVAVPIHGIATFSTTPNQSVANTAIVVDKTGLLLFNGVFRRPELTWKIKGIWDQVNKSELIQADGSIPWHTIEIAVDTVNSKIYCAVPIIPATHPNYLIVGDYTMCEGTFDPLKIKWTVWKLANSPTTIQVAQIGSLDSIPVLRFGTIDSVAGYIFTPDDPTANFSDNGQVINSYAQTYYAYYKPKKNQSYEGWIHSFNALRARITGTGNLQLTMKGLDNRWTQYIPKFLKLQSTPGFSLTRQMGFNNEKMSLILQTGTAVGENFSLDRLEIFCNPMLAERPGGF